MCLTQFKMAFKYIELKFKTMEPSKFTTTIKAIKILQPMIKTIK